MVPLAHPSTSHCAHTRDCPAPPATRIGCTAARILPSRSARWRSACLYLGKIRSLRVGQWSPPCSTTRLPPPLQNKLAVSVKPMSGNVFRTLGAERRSKC
jgi:hypothetical protein